MAIIGSAYVEIHALDKFLQRDIDNAMKKIKDPSLNFSADINLIPIRTKIKALRAELKNAPLQMRIEANYQEVLDTLDSIKDEQEKDPLVFNIDTNVAELEVALERVKENYSSISSNIEADANTAAAEAQLNFAARNRRSTVSMNIDPKTKAALEGLLYTLVGALPADRIKGTLQAVATNFEGLAFAGAKLATVLGTVGAVGLTAGANLFTLSSGIGDVIGIAAAAPAALSAMAAGVITNVIAWKGFGEAVTGEGKKGAEALAKLPPAAQKAAIAMRGLGSQISKPVRNAFWEAMGTSLQDTAKVLVPLLANGLTKTGDIMGKMTSNILSSFRELGESGGLDTLFKGINAGWEGVSKGAKPFFDAMNTLAVSGSKFLGPFGDAVGNLGIRFNNFIQEAERTGQIDVWIREATNSIKNLGSIVGSTVKTFQGLSEAAAMSGGASLEDFANGMKNIATVVNGEPFQSRLVSVLKDARSGSEALGDGFGTLTSLIGKSTDAIGEFLQTSGQISGKLLSNITAMFNGTGLGTGLLTSLWGLEDAMTILEPGFRNLGEILGDLGEISGTVFTSMAPGLNNLLETLAGVTNGLKDGVIAAMPIFNEFFQGILQAASGPIIAIAEGVGNLLELFAQMPGPIQTVITTLGILLLFRGKIADLFAGIAASFGRMQSGIAGQTAGLSTSMQNMYGHFKTAGTHIGSAGNAMRLMPFAATTSGMGGLATAAGAATASIGKAAGAGLRGALSGGAAMLGGPWGIALGAGIALLAAYGQAQADSAARVKELSGTLDQQAGTITNATKKLVATNALDGATNDWDNFVRGIIEASASVEETLGDLGISTKEYTDRLSDPSGRDAFTKNLGDITVALKQGKPITDEMAASIGTTKEQLKGITGQSLAHLAAKAKGAADELSKAETQVKAIADATGTNSVQAAILSRNYEVLASKTSSANDKFSALKQNLDVLSGGSQSFANSQKGVAQSLDDTKNKLKEIVTDSGGSLEKLYSVKDGFDFASQAGRDLHTALEGSSDSILKIGTAALDQAIKGGKSAGEANAIALQSMQPAIASLREQLASTGLLPPQIDAIVRSFGLMPDQISTAISVEGAEEAQKKMFLTKLAADSFANGNYTAALAVLPQAAKDAIAKTMDLGDEFARGDYEAILKTLDLGVGGREAALAALLSYDGSDWTAFLKANNLVPKEVAAANAAADKLIPEKTTTLRVNDLATETIAGVNSYVVGDKRMTMTANNLVTDVLNTINNSPLGDKHNQLTTTDLVTQMVNDINAKQLNNKLSKTETRDLVSAVIDEVNRKTLNGKNNTLTTQDLATAVVNAANNVVLRSKSATLTYEYRTIGKPPIHGQGQTIQNAFQANGGVWRNNVQTFADGGMLQKIRAFAGGGTENHVAQIAKGAWPARMWAEPETGGEAYIPLAMSKRLRSFKILEQVAKMFGFGLFKQFADGGILNSMMPHSGGSSSYAPTTTTISAPIGQSNGESSDRPNVSLTINSTQGYTPAQLATTAVSELAWQFLNR